MSRVGHCADNGPTEGFWGIIRAVKYQLYEITDENGVHRKTTTQNCVIVHLLFVLDI